MQIIIFVSSKQGLTINHLIHLSSLVYKLCWLRLQCCFRMFSVSFFRNSLQLERKYIPIFFSLWILLCALPCVYVWFKTGFATFSLSANCTFFTNCFFPDLLVHPKQHKEDVSLKCTLSPTSVRHSGRGSGVGRLLLLFKRRSFSLLFTRAKESLVMWGGLCTSNQAGVWRATFLVRGSVVFVPELCCLLATVGSVNAAAAVISKKQTFLWEAHCRF